MSQAADVRRMWTYCQEAAYSLPLTGSESVMDVADTSYGIACCESECLRRRQIGFESRGSGGAWSFWQLEEPALFSAVKWLACRPEGDRILAVIARAWMIILHEPAGRGCEEQAVWWKTYWNTAAGKGRIEDYRRRLLECEAVRRSNET